MIDTSKDLPDKRKTPLSRTAYSQAQTTDSEQERKGSTTGDDNSKMVGSDRERTDTGSDMPGGLPKPPPGLHPPVTARQETPAQEGGDPFESMTEAQKSTAMLNMLLQQGKTLEKQGSALAEMQLRQDRLEFERSSTKGTQRPKSKASDEAERELKRSVRNWREGVSASGKPKDAALPSAGGRATSARPPITPPHGQITHRPVTKADPNTKHPSPTYPPGYKGEHVSPVTDNLEEAARRQIQQSALQRPHQHTPWPQHTHPPPNMPGPIYSVPPNAQGHAQPYSAPPAIWTYQNGAPVMLPQYQPPHMQQAPYDGRAAQQSPLGHLTPPHEADRRTVRPRPIQDPFLTQQYPVIPGAPAPAREATRAPTRAGGRSVYDYDERLDHKRRQLTYDGKFIYQAKDIPKLGGWGQGGRMLLSFIRAMDKRMLTCADEEITLRPAVMFEDEALEWYDNLDNDEIIPLDTWPKWRKKILDAFLSTEHMLLVQNAAINKIVREGDDIREYFATKLSLLRTAFPEMSEASIGSLILAGTPAEWRAGVYWKATEHSLQNLQHMMQQHAPQLHSMWWSEQLDRRDSSGRPTNEFYKKLETLDSSSFSLAPGGKQKKGKDKDKDNKSSSNKMSTPDSNHSTPSPPARRKPPADAEAWRRKQREVLGREPAFPEPPKFPCGRCGRSFHYPQDCLQDDKGNSKPANSNNVPVQSGRFRGSGDKQ